MQHDKQQTGKRTGEVMRTEAEGFVGMEVSPMAAVSLGSIKHATEQPVGMALSTYH